VIEYDERKAADLHPLWITELGKEGSAEDETVGRQAPAEVQGLRPQVHAAVSEADRASREAGSICHGSMNIIEAALQMCERVQGFREQVRRFFYEVMLSGHACPRCEGALLMAAEGKCQCSSCGNGLDPTIAFQRCNSCGGKPKVRIRRYVCGACGADIVSQFLFDGLVFDAEYFRQKVAESRERKRELRERVRQMLAESRSNALQLEALEPASASDLFQAIDALTLEAFAAALPLSRNRFDLRRYEAHIQAHLRPIPLSLEQIPPLSEDTRLDRVWRFIALIFLAHAGIVQIWQQGDTIMVIPRETNGERQAVPGDLEEADGVEGTLGRVEA
jgi:hypothetical protein